METFPNQAANDIKAALYVYLQNKVWYESMMFGV